MWLLLIAIVVVVVIGIKRKQERDEKARKRIREEFHLDDDYSVSSSYSTSTTKNNSLYNFPDDAHAAVEAFACLLEKVIRFHESRHFRTENMIDFSVATVIIQHENASGYGRIEMWFDFDVSTIAKDIEDCGYHLSNQFSIENDIVKYKSDRLCNVKSWLPNISDTYNLDISSLSADSITATVVNNCPHAYECSRSVSEGYYFMKYKFR